MKKHTFPLVMAAAIAFAGPASAEVTLTFEGVGNLASVNDFYNGGTDSAGLPVATRFTRTRLDGETHSRGRRSGTPSSSSRGTASRRKART